MPVCVPVLRTVNHTLHPAIKSHPVLAVETLVLRSLSARFAHYFGDASIASKMLIHGMGLLSAAAMALI